MNQRKMIYIAIIAFCILSVIAAIFDQIYLAYGRKNKENIIENTEIETKSQETLKKEFDNMFNNSIELKGYDVSTVKKNDESKEIVYKAYDIEEIKENKYEVDIKLPVVNIAGDVASSFNGITQKIFADKATEILQNSKIYTIYSMTYTGYINGDTLSIIIKSTLKEGSSAQRVIVQTYNYNLKTGKEVTIYDAIEQRGIDVNQVTEKVNSEITKAIKEANRIQASGYETYTRDINNDIYQTKNISTFFIGNDAKLYIVFAYGNNGFTSEMDIIEI